MNPDLIASREYNSMLKREIERLKSDRDAAIARAEAAEGKADREYANMSAQINELVCAKAATERKLAMAAEVFRSIAAAQDLSRVSDAARRAAAELEKADD